MYRLECENLGKVYNVLKKVYFDSYNLTIRFKIKINVKIRFEIKIRFKIKINIKML